MIDPNAYNLLHAAPRERRQFVDWGVFHREPTFLTYWRRYQRALAQRNALLKKANQQELDVWDYELAHCGTIVAEQRSAYIDCLMSPFLTIANHFLKITRYELRHIPGWDRCSELLVLLQKDRKKDIQYGYTNHGPHRGDVLLMADGRPAQNVLSRGQIKIIVLALKLAQMHLLNEQSGHPGCILIDDLESELDKKNQTALLAFLSQLNSQVFITSTSNQLFEKSCDVKCDLFLAKQGTIIQA